MGAVATKPVKARCLHHFYADEALLSNCHLCDSDNTFVEGNCPCSEQLLVCPTCETELAYFSGLEGSFEYLFCPNCNDWAFDFQGNTITRLI